VSPAPAAATSGASADASPPSTRATSAAKAGLAPTATGVPGPRPATVVTVWPRVTWASRAPAASSTTPLVTVSWVRPSVSTDRS
jgi:hypothetical protein